MRQSGLDYTVERRKGVQRRWQPAPGALGRIKNIGSPRDRAAHAWPVDRTAALPE